MSVCKNPKINGPEPRDGQVWRDTSDGDLLLIVSTEDGMGSRVVLLGESNIGFCLNLAPGNPKSPAELFEGPEEVEYVGMFHEVFTFQEPSK